MYPYLYRSLRDGLINRLEHAAAAHEAGRYEEIGEGFDTIADHFDALPLAVPRGSPESDRLNTAMSFWNSWIGARYDGWHNRDDIPQADWPRLARSLAADLAADRQPSHPIIRACFDVTRNRAR